MELNCKILMRNYLLQKIKVYNGRYWIALFCTLIVANIIIWSFNNHYLPIISIYIASFITFSIILIIIYFACAHSISNEEYDSLVRKCQLCIADPNIKNIQDLKPENFANYTGSKFE